MILRLVHLKNQEEIKQDLVGKKMMNSLGR